MTWVQQVESAEERLVLFVLSQIIFGTLERPVSEAIYFSPHPENETGKILWVSGEAVGFYTIKEKGERIWFKKKQGCVYIDVYKIHMRWETISLLSTNVGSH